MPQPMPRAPPVISACRKMNSLAARFQNQCNRFKCDYQHKQGASALANAIKKISVQRGHDVTAYTLTCFGGAAGQHACLVADALGMERIFIHPLAGVLSAWGMLACDLRYELARTHIADASRLDPTVLRAAYREKSPTINSPGMTRPLANGIETPL